MVYTYDCISLLAAHVLRFAYRKRLHEARIAGTNKGIAYPHEPLTQMEVLEKSGRRGQTELCLQHDIQLAVAASLAERR